MSTAAVANIPRASSCASKNKESDCRRYQEWRHSLSKEVVLGLEPKRPTRLRQPASSYADRQHLAGNKADSENRKDRDIVEYGY
jgi:hypothetical protein